MEHYDVIIIGTGAGGGTLAHRLAPSGKRILLLERGGYLPREPENWDSQRGLRPRALRHHRDAGIDKHGGRVSPARPVLRRRQHQGLRRDPLPPARARFRRGRALRRRLARLAHLLRRLRALLRPGRAALPRPRPGRARTRPSRRGRARSPTRGLPRAADPAASRRPRQRAGTSRSTCRSASTSTSPTRRRAAACAATASTASLPDRRQGRRARALRAPRAEAPERHAAHPREGHAAGAGLLRTVGQAGRGRPRRLGEESYSADVVVVSCGAVNSAALLLRSASDAHPNGLANSSDVVGRHYMAHLNSAVIAISRTPNETKFQKTLGLNDYYWGAADSELPARAHPDARQVRPQHPASGAPRFAPGLALDYIAKHAIDFWLTTEDLPHPDNRVTVDRRREHPPGQDLPQHRAPPAAAGQAQGRSWARWAATRSAIPRWSVLSQQIPLAGIAHNCGTVRFGTDPGAPRSTSTARRTTLTTSTSSTPASSRPRAR